jgi:hypothetical protein
MLYLVTIHDLLDHKSDNGSIKLSRDILIWGSERFDEFRFTELGKWLIENHRPFKEEFAGSHIPRSYRLHAKRNYIKSRMEDLIELGLIEKHGTAKAEKNQSDTPIYKFTLGGIIVGAILMASKTSQESAQNSATTRAILLISTYLKHNNASTFLFLSNFFTKCEQERWYGNKDFIHMLRVLFSYLYHSGEFNIRQARLAVMCIPTLYEDLEDIFFQTLNELDEQTRKLLLLQFKMDIEADYSYKHQMDTEIVREWELMRFENIQNYSKVTLSGYCQECKLSYPFVMDIFEFIRLPDILAVEHRIDPDTIQIEESTAVLQKIDCFKCGKESCLIIIPNWYAVEKVHPLKASWYTTSDPRETELEI